MRRLFSVTALLVMLGANTVPGVDPVRVCADPNNLPFSNSRHEGFENRLADMLAGDLGSTVSYTWWAQRRGFLRETLNAGKCDVVMGTTQGAGPIATTRPYYRSTYVFVTRAGSDPAIESFDDPALRRLRIAVQVIGDDGANSPPAHALSRRGIVSNLVGYSIFGDYRTDSPQADIVAAVARGDVDVAAIWGPLAGYFAPRQRPQLRLRAVRPSIDGPLPQTFAISMAVRRDDAARLLLLERFIDRRRKDIDALLAEYHVPRVDASGAVAW